METKREWGIIVFGEKNKGKITYDMMRSFATMFRQKGAYYGLNLVDSPAILFTKNIDLARNEMEDWLGIDSEPAEILVIFFNDSDSDEVEETVREAIQEQKILLYEQSSCNLLRCANEETEIMLTCWIKEVRDLLYQKVSYDSSHSAIEAKSFKTDPVAENEEELALDCITSNGDKRQRSVDDEKSQYKDDLLNFSDVKEILVDLKIQKSLKDLDLISRIDSPALLNRLYIPFSDREQNGQLLTLLSTVVKTELPHLQNTVVSFIEKILASGFISSVLHENTHFIYDNASNNEYCTTMFSYLQSIMDLLYIAEVNHIQQFAIVYKDFTYFMEHIPENCWSSIDEEQKITVFKMLQKLAINFNSDVPPTNLNDCTQLNTDVNKLEVSENMSVSSVKKRDDLEEYKLAWIDNETVEPPEDFRTLSVFPSTEDLLHPVRPYIRRNIVEGSYVNQEHYLDVQFRLLREDFTGPLRDGIKAWKERKGNGAFLSHALDANEELDLFVLSGVKIEGAQLKRVSGEILRYIVFQPIDADSHWSSRLKFGQLVILSSDGFEKEVLLATVAEKDMDDYARGKLGLCFFDDHSVSRTKIYTLVESNSYYEMYQHVLECVKRFDANYDIPFGRYLIKAEPDVKLPSYLAEKVASDRSDSSDSSSTEYTDDSYSDSSCGNKKISIFGVKYELDNLKYTLDGDKVGDGLDDAQRNALCHALTHEIALIQGPPGTGKTFLGRLIVRILLENINLWNPARRNPILVVCYTNHALDQFLEGVLADLITDGRYSSELPSIVRLGSRCRSDILQNYSRQKVVDDYDHLIPTEEKKKTNIVTSKKAKLLGTIRTQVSVLTLRKKEILSFKYVQKAMLPEHAQQFKSQGKVEELFCMWLLEGCGDISSHTSEESTDEISDDLEDILFSENESSEIPVMWSMDETLLTEEHKVSEIIDNFETDEQMTWKEMQEQLLKADPDNEEYYCTGVWDINKDPNPTYTSSVTILQESVSKDLAKYAYLLSELLIVKDDILNSPPLTAEEASSIYNLQTLHRERRWALYMYWINELKVITIKKLDELLKLYQAETEIVQARFDDMHQIVLQKALIIGATTTGAAKKRLFLDRLACPIVVVEEAAEVLEAHVLTSITKDCQHAILIGDHQQLRPHPSVFALAREYKLDISLFERLIKNKFPNAVLERQHRMALLISNTLMPEFYPLMEDADNVRSYPDVKGCNKNLYFISHQHEEDIVLSTSRKNSFEGDFMLNLANYFVQQGYCCSQITLLCAYTSQASYVRTQAISRFGCDSFPDVETVDNYQGYENDIIILSLVRSQPSDSIGFLGLPNRVCVALSRARLGLYIVGNMQFLRSNSTLWNRLCISLIEAGCIGDGFPAFCSKHDVTQIICSAEDFNLLSPEGGCYYSCDFVLPCGHVCNKPCHRSDSLHEGMCTNACLRTCSTVFRHPCLKMCGEQCGPCESFENKVFVCGHSNKVICYLFDKAVCNQKCPKKLACGHQCMKRCNEQCKCSYNMLLACGHIIKASCSDKKEVKCRMSIEITLPHCTHRQVVLCCDSKNAVCNSLCRRILPCGHFCQSVCGNCTLLGCSSCSSVCGRRLSCGHVCKRSCGLLCEPCHAPCANQCAHGPCSGQTDVQNQKAICGDLCRFCVQPCANTCKHRSCLMQCWQVCNISPCDYPCDKKLKCGHACLSLCGEICPDICAKCENMKYPVLQFQGCKCIIAVEEADFHISKQTSNAEAYTCPKCNSKLPANCCFRYAKQLKKQINMRENAKFAKFIKEDLPSDAQINLLKEAQSLLSELNATKDKKRALLSMQIAEILELVALTLEKYTYGSSAIVVWQKLMNIFSDLCQLVLHKVNEKLKTVPQKRFSNLYKIINDTFGVANNILLVLENDVIDLLSFAVLLQTEAPSILQVPLENKLRKICIKYILACLANELVKKTIDLSEEQLNDLLRVTEQSLSWTSDDLQKKATIRFMKCVDRLYETFEMRHMLVRDFRCLDFPC